MPFFWYLTYGVCAQKLQRICYYQLAKIRAERLAVSASVIGLYYLLPKVELE